MKYTIISIDDSRKEFKDKIRLEMSEAEEINVECFDARPTYIDLNDELQSRGLHFADHWKNLMWKRGDIGGFISHFNAWSYAATSGQDLLVFEDDAIVPDGFYSNVNDLLSEVPDDYGVVSFCVNEYGRHFYDNHVEWDEWGYHHVNRPRHAGEHNQFDYGAERMTKAYQSWTLTATLYSSLGAQSLVNAVHDMGIHMNADAFVFHRSHCGDFKAYAPKPQYLDLVAEFYEGHSLIQSAEA